MAWGGGGREQHRGHGTASLAVPCGREQIPEGMRAASYETGTPGRAPLAAGQSKVGSRQQGAPDFSPEAEPTVKATGSSSGRPEVPSSSSLAPLQSPWRALLRSQDLCLGPAWTTDPTPPDFHIPCLAGWAPFLPGDLCGRVGVRAAALPLQPAKARHGTEILSTWLPALRSGFRSRDGVVWRVCAFPEPNPGVGDCPTSNTASQNLGRSLGEGRGTEAKGEVRPLFLSLWHEAPTSKPHRLQGENCLGGTTGTGSPDPSWQKWATKVYKLLAFICDLNCTAGRGKTIHNRGKQLVGCVLYFHSN